MSANRIVT